MLNFSKLFSGTIPNFKLFVAEVIPAKQVPFEGVVWVGAEDVLVFVRVADMRFGSG